MKIDELQKDSTIKDWFASINPADTTIPTYLGAMQEFTEFTGKTPDELITEAEQEILDGLLPRKRSIKQRINGFRKRLQDNGLAEKTVLKMVTAVRSFYKSNEIDLPIVSQAENQACAKEENTPVPEKEDIQAVLRVCDPLEKALVLIGVSSGLSSNEIIKLKVKQFKDGYDSETMITTLHLRRQKKKVDFITFLSPEASSAIWDYLDYRNRTTKNNREKRINQLDKQRVFSDNDFLFCRPNISDKYLTTKNEKERQITTSVMMHIYRTISEKAGKNSVGGNWNLIRSHNMRKYFNSTLLNKGCDSFHVEFFMGHKMDATKAAYFRASPEKLRELYLQYVPYLTIQKEADVSESDEYKRIKNENQILAAETARHVVERKELQDLRTELAEAKAETASKAVELEKRSIASVSNYEELQKQLQEMQAKMREITTAPFERNREISEEERLDIEIKMLEAKRSKLRAK